MKQKLFIALFILSLIGPPVSFVLMKDFIDTENYENRTLASFPRLTWDNVEQIPGEFEEFLNDHAPYKNFFVNLNTRLETKLFGVASVAPITVGTDNWLFYTVDAEGEDALSDYQHVNLYTADEQEEIAGKIQGVVDGMAEQGIRFYVFEAPNKERIYGKYMPQSIHVYGPKSRLDAIIPELQNKGLPVYDLADSLRQYAEDYQVFCKYDTHWNLVGSFLASQQISQVVFGNSVPLEEITIVPGDETSGDMASMLNMVNEFHDDVSFSIEGYLPQITAEKAEPSEHEGITVFHSDSPNEHTLLVIADSFGEALMPFLPKLYQTAIFSTFTSYTPELFSWYDVDDVIYLNVERNQRYFERIPEVVNGTYAGIAGEEESAAGMQN